MNDLYDTDFALWSEQQAQALRRRAVNEIDWDNVAEEIEALAKNDRRDLASVPFQKLLGKSAGHVIRLSRAIAGEANARAGSGGDRIER